MRLEYRDEEWIYYLSFMDLHPIAKEARQWINEYYIPRVIKMLAFK